MLGLARNGFMTIDQIKDKWWGGKYWGCIKRLKKLCDDKKLEVTYVDRHGKGIYYLTKDGLTFINGYFGVDYKQYSKSSKIPHNISCSEFYINIPPSIKVVDYEIEFFLEDFIPDIYMACESDDRELEMLVEIDNLGRSSRFLPKIKKYADFYSSGNWREKFDKFPRCVVVSDSKDLKDKIKQHTNIPFRVITFEELKNNGVTKCVE